MIELAKDMQNLVSFAYISTAYCHLEEKVSAIFVYLSFVQKFASSRKILTFALETVNKNAAKSLRKQRFYIKLVKNN